MPTTSSPYFDSASNMAANAAAKSANAPMAAPAAPCCTGLECIEKPRFFCGQLLTDLDLDAAMNYIAAKNRLHNRYLFGAGVVCGLIVQCDPCVDGSVIINPGYALDCLGNDIIFCSPYTFDVAGYLDCRKKQQAGCNGTKPQIPKDCETPEVEYCLVISYDEKPTKPVSALIRDNGCRVSRCEPSRTLEVFKVDLIDHDTAMQLNVLPTFWSRLMTCIKDEGEKIVAYLSELAAIEQMTHAQQQADAIQAVVARMKKDIIEFSQANNPVHCNLIDQLCAIDAVFRVARPVINLDRTNLEGVSPAAGAGSVVQALRAYFLLYVQLLIDCVCNAYLIPCNDCCEPEYVLLACLKVRDGKVISICNTVRSQVLSAMSVRYWLQPLFSAVGKVMEYLCCTLDLSKYVGDRAGFVGLHTKVQQTINTYKVAKAYSSNLVQQVKNKAVAVPNPADNPNQASATTFYKQPLDQVQKNLAAMGVTFTVKRAATVGEAYSISNIPQQTFTVNRGAHVEVLVAPDNSVAGIRTIAG